MTHNLNPELEELLEELREYREGKERTRRIVPRISETDQGEKGLSPESNRWLRRIKNQETLTGVVIA